jgi:phosphoglycolate phosphatase-like HAD superfamily hydrolase
MGSPVTKAIIFDFDGTLADSFSVMLQILHTLIRRKLVKEDISRLRGMRSRDVLRELHISPWRALFLSAKVRHLMSDRMNEIPLIPGIDQALRVLAHSYPLYILSANSVANAREFLTRNHIADVFSGVYGGVQPWMKRGALKKILKERKLNVGDVWYVGDGYLDVKAAHRAGMKAVAVAWGYSNIHVLESCHPEALVFSSEELVEHFVRNTQ